VAKAVKKQMPSSQRLGMMVLLASVAAAGLVIFFFLNQNRQLNREQIHRQSYQLVRLLAKIIPAKPESATSRLAEVRHALDGVEDTPSFAYLAVLDKKGAVLERLVPSGGRLPSFSPDLDPAFWFYERTGRKMQGGKLMEFGAPLLDHGELQGHLALGFYEPTINLIGHYRGLLADMFLPIFLLGTIFYLLFKQETKVISTLSGEIRQLIDKDTLPPRVSLKASGEVRGLAEDLNQLLKKNISRLKEMEDEYSRVLDSSKVVQYKKNRLEAIFELMPDGFLIMDDACSPTYANRRFAALLGLEPKDIIGSHYHLWCHNERLSALFSRYQSGGKECLRRSEEISFVPEHAPGTTILVRFIPFSHRDKGAVSGILVLAHDVTAEVMAEKARDEFIAQVSHELKAPLNVIKIYNEMLMGEDGKQESFRLEAVNTINDAVERLTMLIKNLLSISQIEMGSIVVERQRVKLLELVQDIFSLVSKTGGRDELEFHLDLPRKMSHVNVDKDLMSVALNNLLTNAVKYNRPGGKVDVAVEENSEEILIRVRDTGIGIAAGDQKNIFDKFYRSADEKVRSREGHGLGLSLAKAIVELHNGRLLVDSTPGEGTEFTIVLRKTEGLVKESL
jgi:PAS domain S-box-containing protein